MRLVHVLTQMEAAGAQRSVTLLAERQLAAGHEVHVVFMYVKRPSHIDVPYVTAIAGAKPSGLAYMGFFIRFIRHLRELRPDVVVTHTHYANVLGGFLSMVAGVRRRVAVQRNPLATYPLGARTLDRVGGSLGLYTAIVGVSRTVMESAARYPARYRARMVQIDNGVEWPSSSKSPMGVRKSFGLPTDFPLLLHIGRLSNQKNQALLVAALPEIPTAHLALVGDGELRYSLETAARQLGIAHRVHFIGEHPWQTTMDLLGSADVFVFPSRFEAFGLALAEAMAMGVPVVASDIPAVREVGGEAVVRTASDSAAELARAIRRVLGDPDLVAQLAARGIRRARHFDVSATVRGYEALFDGLTRARTYSERASSPRAGNSG